MELSLWLQCTTWISFKFFLRFGLSLFLRDLLRGFLRDLLRLILSLMILFLLDLFLTILDLIFNLLLRVWTNLIIGQIFFHFIFLYDGAWGILFLIILVRYFGFDWSLDLGLGSGNRRLLSRFCFEKDRLYVTESANQIIKCIVQVHFVIILLLLFFFLGGRSLKGVVNFLSPSWIGIDRLSS